LKIEINQTKNETQSNQSSELALNLLQKAWQEPFEMRAMQERRHCGSIL
jgi:hypothetical protein